MIRLLMVVLSYLFVGLLFATAARDNDKSIMYSIGLLVAWPLYAWFYAFYYGAQFVMFAFRPR